MIRRRPALGAALAGAVGMAAVLPALAQFNPEGRRPPTPHPEPRAAAPASPEQARARSLKRALSRPEDTAALERALELHRGAHGGPGGLEALREALAQATENPRTARAARLHLAWLLRSLGLREAAQQALEARLAEAPDDALAHERLARLLAETQRSERAYAHLEQAAARAPRRRRAALLAELVAWAITLGNREGARRHHKAWTRAVGAGPAAALELPRQLSAGGQLEWAAEEYEALARLGTLPLGERATLWGAWGATLVELGRFEQAIEVLAKAARKGRSQPGLSAEVFEHQVRAYRGLGRLEQLVEPLQSAVRPRFGQSLALGRLCEELGRLACAEKALRRALGQRPGSREARQQLLYVLQQRGKLKSALAQRQRLAHADPRDLPTGLALARELLQQGDREAALVALKRLARRTRDSGEAQAQVADFYESIGEPERSQELLERHARSHNRAALLALGERHFVRGDDEAAAQIWQKWVAQRSEEPQAWLELGRVLLDHDLLARGLEAFQRAHDLSGGRARERRALALALERVGAAASAEGQRAARYRQAQSLWRQLASEAESQGDPLAAEEARSHLVTLWALSETLGDQAQRLSVKLLAMPQDRSSRRLLAKVYARLGRAAEAEAELLTLLDQSPHDSLLEDQLEQAWVAQGKTDAALERLEARARRQPERAQEYWQRMARYAAQAHDDARALELNQKAAGLAPLSTSTTSDRAQALAQLAERHLALGQLAAASDAYDKLLRREPGRHDLRLRAARVLLWRGRSAAALEQLLTVSEGAREEALVRSAGELALEVASQEQSLEAAERRWLRSYVRQPTRADLRDLLLSCYEAQLSQPPGAARSPTEVGRATKPLVDALHSEEATERQRALDLLQHLPSPEANPALLFLAEKATTLTDRARAILAATLSPDPASFRQWAELVGTGLQATMDPVARQATWALARADHPRARALLAPLERHPSPELRALALLSNLDHPSRLPPLPQLWQPGHELPWAVGLWLRAKPGAELPGGGRLLLRSEDALLRGTALLSLARGAPGQALEPIAAALVHPDSTLRRAALGAACLLVTPLGRRRLRPTPAAADGRAEVPTARAALRAQWPEGCSLQLRTRALARLLPALEQVLGDLPSHPAGVRALAELLTSPSGKPQAMPLLPDPQLSQAMAGKPNPTQLKPARPPLPEPTRLAELRERLQRAALPTFLRAASSPDRRTRGPALRWLAARPEDKALSAVLHALQDPDPALQRQAHRALEGEPRPEAAKALLAIAQGSAPWHSRHAALATLAKLSPRAAKGLPVLPLARLAERDRYAAVRHGALSALCHLHGEAARPVLERVRTQDAEPLLRQTAATWLEELR